MLSKRESGVIDRRASILAAARRIIARDGFDALTTRGIAKAAGVTVPTLYNLVGDKTAIISAMATNSINEMWSRVQLDQITDPLALADSVIDAAFKQIMADPEFNRANLIALERLGIAFAYHPNRDDSGADAARRSVAMVEYACEQAQAAGQLRGAISAHEIGLQLFSVYRAPLDDWLHGAIELDEMQRRQRVGFYTVLAADASETLRIELLAKIAALSAAPAKSEAA